MTEVNEEVQAHVTELREAKPFNVLAAIREVTYPVAKVRVYTDGEAASELEELYADRKLEQAEGAMASAELNEIEARIEEVEAEIKSSALTFHLRGVPPKVKRIIQKEAVRKFKAPKDADEDLRQEFFNKANEYVTYEFIRHAIVKVEAADGGVDTHGWSFDEVEELDNTLFEAEFSKIDEAAAKLTSAARLFNESLDADFLSKS